MLKRKTKNAMIALLVVISISLTVYAEQQPARDPNCKYCNPGMYHGWNYEDCYLGVNMQYSTTSFDGSSSCMIFENPNTGQWDCGRSLSGAVCLPGTL